ncbi:AsmA protein [Thioalkalivibrio sp. ALE21]|uniref:AsmA family protein n=1 Tax=Thioalkalivibrio sp. ALE21 TaxID=1158175 RepID=UPI000D9D98F6|nr:AsmA family protein [Thioalkalivibrio sp. ALE21]PYG03676.1 AsmA protein [Thioalkalivibrio sp. ALE21]
MKWIKRLFGLIGILILVVIVVAAYLLVTFDANDYKERIEAQVHEQTGRDLELAGDVSLTLFPTLGLRLEDVRFGNAEGFGDEPFAEVDVVDVAVAVMPLLRRELEVQRVEGDGVRLNLARDEDGRNNWDDLAARADEARDEAVTGDEDEERTATESRLAMERIDIAGISLTNARVVWDDRETGMRAVLDPFSLQVGRFQPGVETRLEMSAALEAEGGALEQPLSTTMDLTGLVNLDLLNNRYAVRRLDLNLDVEGGPVPQPMAVLFRSDVALEVDEDDTRLRMERLTVEASRVTLTGFAELGNLQGDQPQMRGELRSNTFNLRSVMDDLGMEAPATTDPDALQRVAFDLSAAGTPGNLELSPFLFTLDDTTLSGDATLDTTGERPHFGFDLRGNELNVDRYLPPEVEEARTGEANGAPDEEEAEELRIELPMEALRSVDVDGSLALDGRLILMGLELRDIALDIRARGGDWVIDPLSATGYDGELTSRIQLDASDSQPRYGLTTDLAGLDIGALLDDLQGDDAMLLGTGNLTLDITTHGEALSDLRANLNGDGDMRFEDGAVRGINVADIIRRAEARIRGREYESDEPRQTDFSEISGSFDIENGVVSNNDLEGNSPLLRVRGQGSADLNDESLDYRVDTTLVGTLEGQGGRSLEDLRGVRLPIRISGTFDDPSFRLDLESILRERAAEELGVDEDELRDEATRRLMERLGLSRDEADEEEANDEQAEEADEDEEDEEDEEAERSLEQEAEDRMRELLE